MTKPTKRKRTRSAIARRAPTPAQMVEIKPHPLLAGAWGAVMSMVRGEPLEKVAENFVGSAMAQTDTRRCRCGAFVLWAPDEMPPVCKCGADLTTAPRATREDVRQVFEDENKPKH